jgi:hypothetical protein
LCTVNELKDFFDFIPSYSLTYTGAFIPACDKKVTEKDDKGELLECNEEDFNFVNAFTGKYAGSKKADFKKFGENVKEKLSLTNIKDLMYPDGEKGGSISPTTGSLHC